MTLRKHLLFFALAVSLLTPAVYRSLAAEKKPLPRDKIDELESLRGLIERLDDLEKAADRLTREKYIHCVKAFGSHKFCECLSNKLPMIVSFGKYVQIITATRDELGYSKLDQESKRMVDTTLEARESCVLPS